MTSNKALLLIGCVLLCELAGAAGAVFTTPAIPAWYQGLAKPWFNPPDWVFGPVWAALYAMMGVALFQVMTATGKAGKNGGLRAFGLQLMLNVLWSAAFFGVQSPGLGLAVIAFLWVAVAATALRFWRISRTAGLLLLPYLAWTAFAAVLNYCAWALN